MGTTAREAGMLAEIAALRWSANKVGDTDLIDAVAALERDSIGGGTIGFFTESVRNKEAERIGAALALTPAMQGINPLDLDVSNIKFSDGTPLTDPLDNAIAGGSATKTYRAIGDKVSSGVDHVENVLILIVVGGLIFLLVAVKVAKS